MNQILDRYTVEKNWDFLTTFSLSNKYTYLAYKFSYRKICEINVEAAKSKNFRLSFPCSEKPLTISVLCKNSDQKVVSAGKWGVEAGKFWIFCSFHVHFASFSVWNLTFLRNVWAFHFCSMWILTTTAFYSPKVHFHRGNADIFPLWSKVGSTMLWFH
jgi:hypothetical protein